MQINFSTAASLHKTRRIDNYTCLTSEAEQMYGVLESAKRCRKSFDLRCGNERGELEKCSPLGGGGASWWIRIAVQHQSR